jgi:hypothetical protein
VRARCEQTKHFWGRNCETWPGVELVLESSEPGSGSDADKQNMASNVNLMEASNQWMNRPADQRFEKLADLRASVNARRMRSRSTDVDLPRVKVEAVGESIAINSVIAPSEPTHWAFSQFAGMLRAPASYLRTLPIPLAVNCLNAGIEAAPREAIKFMTIASEGDGPATLQACTSPTYGRIWDADCVDAVGRIVERTGGKFYNPLAYDRATGAPKPSGLYASDRDVFMFMIDGGSRLEVGPRAKLNRGFFCWNSEVGARTFGLTTFLFNECCGNHIVWGASEIKQLTIRHTQNGPYRFDSEAAPVLMAYAQSSARTEETAIRRAMGLALPKDEKEFDRMIACAKLTRAELKEAIASAKREEGQCATLWDLVQGITAYARGFDFVDARVDLETRAGKLLQQVAGE